MSTVSQRLIFWAPRVLAILFAAFLAVFALDVFGAGYGPWETLFALFMHLIPSLLVLLLLIVAWRWEWIGAVVFAGLGLTYIVWAWGQFPLITYVTVSGPLFLIAVLFWVGWIGRQTGSAPVSGPPP